MPLSRLVAFSPQLTLATAQLRDLTRQRQLVYLEKDKIEKEEIRKVELRLQQLAKDRKKTQQRLQALKKKPDPARKEAQRVNVGACPRYEVMYEDEGRCD